MGGQAPFEELRSGGSLGPLYEISPGHDCRRARRTVGVELNLKPSLPSPAILRVDIRAFHGQPREGPWAPLARWQPRAGKLTIGKLFPLP